MTELWSCTFKFNFSLSSDSLSSTLEVMHCDSEALVDITEEVTHVGITVKVKDIMS